MNRWQRNILRAALVAVAVTMLFPPFSLNRGVNGVVSMGYGFILSPPSIPDYERITGTVDVFLLLAEWLAIAMVCGMLWMLGRDDKTG